jgi:hypothetical protein
MEDIRLWPQRSAKTIETKTKTQTFNLIKMRWQKKMQFNTMISTTTLTMDLLTMEIVKMTKDLELNLARALQIFTQTSKVM